MHKAQAKQVRKTAVDKYAAVGLLCIRSVHNVWLSLLITHFINLKNKFRIARESLLCLKCR